MAAQDHEYVSFRVTLGDHQLQLDGWFPDDAPATQQGTPSELRGVLLNALGRGSAPCAYLDAGLAYQVSARCGMTEKDVSYAVNKAAAAAYAVTHPDYSASWETPAPGDDRTKTRQARDMFARFIARAVAADVRPNPRHVAAFKRWESWSCDPANE